MTIAGPGANLLTISGGNQVQVFNITSGTVTISGLTIANGRDTSGFGAGIQSTATLTVSNCTFSGNTSGSGGGIYGAATTMVSNSTFSGNTATEGGGIYNNNGGTLTVNNSTLSGNSAGEGDGIFNLDMLTLNNNIVAGNKSSDCFNCGTPSDNLIGGNPKLAPLGWYGGPTQTMLPLPGSPVIDAGLAIATDDPNRDQRGFGRPSAAGNTVDLGAVQTNYLIVVTNVGPGQWRMQAKHPQR